jgi:hypothetical protein
MASEVWKFLRTFTIGLLVGFYKAFVLMFLWNWFVPRILHVEEVSFWQMLMLLWIVHLIVGYLGDDTVNEMRWERLFLVVTLGVPQDQQEYAREELSVMNQEVWSRLGISCLAHIVEYTITLGLGWAVHGFLV